MRDNSSSNGDRDILVGRCRQGRPGTYGRDSLDGSRVPIGHFHRENDGRFGRDPMARDADQMNAGAAD